MSPVVGSPLWTPEEVDRLRKLVDRVRHLNPGGDSHLIGCMRVWRMRTGIYITLKPADRRRLKALARDRNAPHKHVWRAEIVLLSADGFGTNEIMRRTGKSKTCVWRWQERFMQAGYNSLLHLSLIHI